MIKGTVHTVKNLQKDYLDKGSDFRHQVRTKILYQQGKDAETERKHNFLLTHRVLEQSVTETTFKQIDNLHVVDKNVIRTFQDLKDQF